MTLSPRQYQSLVVHAAFYAACKPGPIVRGPIPLRAHWSVRDAVVYATCLVALWQEVV